MSNREIIELTEITVEEHQVREVLKCIIHTIIFNRALGHVSPRDMDLQLINISYVEVADDDIEKLVEEGLRKAEAFLKTLKPRSSSGPSGKASEGDGVRFTVRLSFYELVNKAGFSSTYQEKIYWEVWKIQLKVVSACQNPADREARRQQIQTDVDNMRIIILHNADSKKDHIPPIRSGNNGALTFSFDITPERQPWLGESLLGRTISRLLAGQAPGPLDGQAPLTS